VAVRPESPGPLTSAVGPAKPLTLAPGAAACRAELALALALDGVVASCPADGPGPAAVSAVVEAAEPAPASLGRAGTVVVGAASPPLL